MISRVLELKANRDLNLYTKLVNVYKKPLVLSKIKIQDLTDEIESLKKKGGFISSLKINMPRTGLQAQLHKESAWYKVYSEIYPQWKQKKEQAQRIVDQVKREHYSKR